MKAASLSWERWIEHFNRGGATKMANVEQPSETKLPASHVSNGLWLAATSLRVLFILILVLLTIRVALPQNETILTVYDTPGDLVRLLLGVGVCVWLIVHLFYGPRDAQGYRTWLYLGLFAVPFAVICLIAIW